MKLAPIAFFAYKRPEHTQRALEALARCELAADSRLIVFCDGPKHLGDAEAVRHVREVVRSRPWCKTVQLVEREENIGLAKSIATGVSKIIERYGKIIVLEDDLVTSPFFLRYMNDALVLYEKDDRVMQISGHIYDVDLPDENDALFLPLTTSWGWGTWRRAWAHFGQELIGSGCQRLSCDRRLRREFNLGGLFDYYRILQLQLSGKIDSWAIIWYLTVFMRNGLVLFPKRSMVNNRGFDGSGTHCGPSVTQTTSFADGYGDFRLPQQIEVHPACKTVYQAIAVANRVSMCDRVKSLKKRFRI